VVPLESVDYATLLFVLSAIDPALHMDMLQRIHSRLRDGGVVLFRDSMLVFGGSDGRKRFNDMWELHLRERRWTQIMAQSSAPRSRFAHTAVMYGHSMFIFGGWDGQDTLQELHEYNVSSNMWIQLPLRGNAPRARYRHTASLCGDEMVCRRRFTAPTAISAVYEGPFHSDQLSNGNYRAGCCPRGVHSQRRGPIFQFVRLLIH